MNTLAPEAKAPASHSAPAPSRHTLFATTAHTMMRGPAVAYAPEAEGGASAESGPLRIDDAVNLLMDADDTGGADDTDTDDGAEDADHGDADPDEDEDEADDQPADADDAPDDEPASDDPDEDEDDETPADPAVDAPKFWSAEEKAAFAKAPPEVQKIVAAKDAEYSRQVSLAKEDAADARKDASTIAQMRELVDKHLERAVSIFQGKWDGIDWAKWARDDVSSYAATKEEFEAEQRELHTMQTVQAATASEEHRQFLKSEGAKLREANHVLADPAKGPEAKKRLIAYAEAQGYTDADLKWAGARELRNLFNSMLYDEASAKPINPAPKPKTATPPKAKTGQVRPSTAPPPRKQTASRHRREVIGRAYQSGRMDDAVAALLAIEKG